MALTTLAATQTENPAPLTDEQLLTEVQRRAFRFFWEQSDPKTGLTNDRAKNFTEKDDQTVASIASTGYALTALPVAVEHRWIERQAAYDRALRTLRFVHDKLPNVHGWHYHFVDKRTGERVWKCELSSIDTCLLVIGALTCGQYFKGTEVERLANAIYDRMDWTWMRTNGGTRPNKKVVSMGWKPEDGWIKSDWGHYCELMLLYLLGLGSKTDPLPTDSWTAWERNVVEYHGMKTLAGGPIFMHQMAHGYYDFHNQKDSLGWDYWQTSVAATRMNRQYCLDRMKTRKTYGPNVWGLNASDGPDGYRAYGVLDEEDGTVSPTGAIASLSFTPDLSLAAARTMYQQYGAKIWGRYGFSNAFNVDRDWYDPDVIGIDLGMALVAIENYRTGWIWKLLASHPATRRAWAAAGFHPSKGVKSEL
ncbi:MAG TPA: glucoamylase family protein [Chthonomonadaceae bacterium]|nr:glucoamylase family protein [Chthonomonadaceae bacterium]